MSAGGVALAFAIMLGSALLFGLAFIVFISPGFVPTPNRQDYRTSSYGCITMVLCLVLMGYLMAAVINRDWWFF